MDPPEPQRRKRLLELLDESKLDAVAVSHLPNVRYLTGYTGSNGILLLTPRSATLYTDPRYELQAARECDCAVKVVKGPLWPQIASDARRRRVSRLAVESEHVTIGHWNSLASLSGRSLKLVAVKDHVERLRAVKSAGEIEAIRRSVQLNSAAFKKTLPKIRPGLTERAIATEIDHQMRRLGASGPAFETIVASGPRSALPHARPTSEPVQLNQLLLIDMGASLEGYSSDMTRVVHLGRPGLRARRLHEAVLEAQLAAIDAVRPGIPCSRVDDAARKTLKRWKLDKCFQHSTGHGLGLEIHEGPRLGAGNESVLEPGMVVTVEPGAYVEGFGGVRIEDTVLVTESGVEVLTPTTKEFLVIAS